MTSASHVAVGRDRGRARPSIDQRDLAEEVARPQVTDEDPIFRDVQAAIGDDVERVAGFALAGDGLTIFEGRLGGSIRDRLEGGRGHAPEERDLAHVVDDGAHDSLACGR